MHPISGKHCGTSYAFPENSWTDAQAVFANLVFSESELRRKHYHQDDHNHYNDDFHTATKVLLSVSFIRDIGCHKVDENCINYYK